MLRTSYYAVLVSYSGAGLLLFLETLYKQAVETLLA